MYKDFKKQFNLINEGVIYVPDKIELTYRIAKDYIKDPYVIVYGLKPNDLHPYILATNVKLVDSDCLLERDLVKLIELENTVGISDIWVRIVNIESLEELYHIVGVFDYDEIMIGEKVNTEGNYCEFAIAITESQYPLNEDLGYKIALSEGYYTPGGAESTDPVALTEDVYT